MHTKRIKLFDFPDTTLLINIETVYREVPGFDMLIEDIRKTLQEKTPMHDLR